MADPTNGFYNTRVSCSSQASYLCEAWSPPCPDGYTWVPSAGNASCFRVRSGGYIQSSSPARYWQSITTAENTCAEDGTRLASPDNQTSYLALIRWIRRYSPLIEASGDSSMAAFWLGYRKINRVFGATPAFDLISPWSSTLANSLPILSYVTTRSGSGVFPNECMYLTTSNDILGYPCLNSDVSDTRALCEYRHGTTLSGKPCVFPFKIGARQYDTCVPFGGPAWCATSVDSSGNMLTKDVCTPSSPVSSCPVGFIYLVRTCIQISAAHPADTVQSVQQAADICMSKGARLYQPRSILSLRTLLYMNHPLFNINEAVDNEASPGLLGYNSGGSLLALGIYGYQSFTFTYGDGSHFPDALVPATMNGFQWSSGKPDDNSTNSCLTLAQKQEFANSPCNGYPDWQGQKLGYICEARPLVTVDGQDPNKTCVFPFKTNANDGWHVSCIYGTNNKVQAV